jgi:hypothetical protein
VVNVVLCFYQDRSSFFGIFLYPSLKLLNWEFSRYSGVALIGGSIICIVVCYLEDILQRIITTIVIVCVRPSNISELLYRPQTTLQQKRSQ